VPLPGAWLLEHEAAAWPALLAAGRAGAVNAPGAAAAAAAVAAAQRACGYRPEYDWDGLAAALGAVADETAPAGAGG
jgi:hypothetical protein